MLYIGGGWQGAYSTRKRFLATFGGTLGGMEQPEGQQVELRPTEHVPLAHLQAVDMPFNPRSRGLNAPTVFLC